MGICSRRRTAACKFGLLGDKPFLLLSLVFAVRRPPALLGWSSSLLQLATPLSQPVLPFEMVYASLVCSARHQFPLSLLFLSGPGGFLVAVEASSPVEVPLPLLQSALLRALPPLHCSIEYESAGRWSVHEPPENPGNRSKWNSRAHLDY